MIYPAGYRIDIVFAVAELVDGNRLTRSGCGVIVQISDEHRQCRSRELGFYLGFTQYPETLLKGLLFSLSSITKAFREAEVIISTGDKRLLTVVDGKAVSRLEIDVHRWMGFFENLSLSLVEDPDSYAPLKRATVLATTAATEQAHYDSGTSQTVAL